MPQDHQQSADAEQDHPGEKLLTVDFAREFVHSFSTLRFHFEHSILAPEGDRGKEVCSDSGGKPASSQILSSFRSPLASQGCAPGAPATLNSILRFSFRNPNSKIRNLDATLFPPPVL